MTSMSIARCVPAVAVAASLLVMSPGSGIAQQGPATPEIHALGPQPGATAPDFELPDQYGQLRTLKSLMGPKGLVLVFNRSAEW